jgi:outer membrane receptor protein involved in Fe transport
VAFRTHTAYIAGFVQDEWKISSKLTVNYGLRWEMDTPRFETNNQQSGFDPVKINPVSRTPGVFTFAGIDGGRIHAHNFDLDNFGPRLGVAWSIGANTVIRAGYGLMIGPIYNSSSTRSASQGFGDIRVLNRPTTADASVLSSGWNIAGRQKRWARLWSSASRRKVKVVLLWGPTLESIEITSTSFQSQYSKRRELVLEGAYRFGTLGGVGRPAYQCGSARRLAGGNARSWPFPQFHALWVGWGTRLPLGI